MEWEEKIWGRVRHAEIPGSAMMSELELLAGTCCSQHYHRDRANLFYVVSGRIIIERIGQRIGLMAGDSLVIPSRVTHRFRVHEAGRVLEMYWADRGGMCLLDDIVRMDQGGSDPEATDPMLWEGARRTWYFAEDSPELTADERRRCGQMLGVRCPDGGRR